jgi:hypothetical protein
MLEREPRRPELTRHLYAMDAGGLSSEQMLDATLSALGTRPSSCALITAAPAAINSARRIGLASIGYAVTPEARRRADRSRSRQPPAEPR